MKFWTKDEFYKFIDSIMDKQKSYAAFMTLFWTGMRLGELLALTPADIDFENKTISISKSYQRFDGKDVITLPKTPKSKRTITVPDFLLADRLGHERVETTMNVYAHIYPNKQRALSDKLEKVYREDLQ